MSRLNHIVNGLIFFSGIFYSLSGLYAQEPVITGNLDQDMENLTEIRNEAIDFTDITEHLIYLQKHPLNLNSAETEDLKNIYFLNDIQINNLLTYRQVYGNFLSINELFAIEGFTENCILRLMPYVTVMPVAERKKISPKEMIKQGRNELYFRYQRIFEKQEGYSSISDSLLHTNPNARYLGSPDKLYLRYGFEFYDDIHWGITAEKDAGEEFFRGSRKNGFDFYSAHLFLKNINNLKALAIGDYHLQFGQGLTMCSNLAFGKSAEATNVKKMSRGITPNSSANEFLFFRGIATTYQIGNFELSGFYSIRKLDAAIQDTSDGTIVLGSIRETGYHRTPGELEGEKKLQQTVAGGHLTFKNNTLRLGFTAFKTMMDKKPNAGIQLYNTFDFDGKSNFNMGLDYDYVYKDLNVFGEISRSENGGLAQIHGLTAYLDERLLLSAVYRNYQKEYQNGFSNAFGENGNNANEKGLYLGFDAKLHRYWNLSGYCDFFTFPWLKYRVDAPSKGSDYLARLNYTPSDRLALNFQYYLKNKQINHTDDSSKINFLDETQKQSFRFQMNYVPFPSVSLKSRIEYVKNSVADAEAKNGFLIFQDISYKSKKWSLTSGYGLFDTDGYDERIYVYESDVLYAFSVPSFENKGSRFYVLMAFCPVKNLDLWIKYSQTAYSDKQVVGSGLEAINASHKQEIKIQMRIKF